MARIIYADGDIKIGDKVIHVTDDDKIMLVVGIWFRANSAGIDMTTYEVEHINGGSVNSQWCYGTALRRVK